MDKIDSMISSMFDAVFDTDVFNSLYVDNKIKLPYSIYQTEDKRFSILELAVAGFSKEEIKVRSSPSAIIISGSKLTGEKRTYLHNGISLKDFEYSWKYSGNKNVKIESVTFKDGILAVKFVTASPDVNLITHTIS